MPGHSAVAFQLLQNDGRPLLSSRRFPNHDACVTGARVAIDRMDARNSYALRKSGSGIRLLLLDDERRELARSRTFDSADEARELRDMLILEAEDHDDYELIHTTGSRPMLDLQLSDDITEAATTLPPESYDFTKTSQSGEQGFELYRNIQRETWGFHFNDAHGQVMMYGPESNSQGARTKMLQQVVRHAAQLGRYQRRDEGGTWIFYLVDTDMMELARSRPFDDEEELEHAIHYANALIPTYASRYGAKLPQAAAPSFATSITSTDDTPGPTLLADNDGHSVFMINDDAGMPLVFSVPYDTPAARDEALKGTLARLAVRTNYELRTDKSGAHFVVLDPSGVEFARSRDFESIDELHLLMAYTLETTPAWCADWGVELVHDSDTEVITVSARRERKPPDADFEAPEPGITSVFREQEPAQRRTSRRDSGVPALVGGPSAALGSEDKPPSAPLGSQEPEDDEIDRPVPTADHQQSMQSVGAYDDDEVTMARVRSAQPPEDTDARFSPAWYSKAFANEKTMSPLRTEEVTAPFIEQADTTADFELDSVSMDSRELIGDDDSSAPDHMIRVDTSKNRLPELTDGTGSMFDGPSSPMHQLPVAASPDKHPLDAFDAPDPETDDVTGFSLPSMPSVAPSPVAPSPVAPTPVAPAAIAAAPASPALRVALPPQPATPPAIIAAVNPYVEDEVTAITPPPIEMPVKVPGEAEALRNLRSSAAAVDDEPLDYQPQRTPPWVWAAAGAVALLGMGIGARSLMSGDSVAPAIPEDIPGSEAREPVAVPVDDDAKAAAAAPAVPENAAASPENAADDPENAADDPENAAAASDETVADDDGVAAIATVKTKPTEPDPVVERVVEPPRPVATPKPTPAPKVQAPSPTPRPAKVESKPPRTPPAAPSVRGHGSVPVTSPGTVAMPDGSTFSLRSGSPEDRISSWLQSGQSGTRVFRLQRHTFDADSAETGSAGAEEIWLIGQLLKAHPDAQIHIRGHRDGGESVAYTGGARVKYADSLSGVRAHTMLRRLRHQGVSSNQLSIQDRGADHPVGSASDNRRIEVAITL